MARTKNETSESLPENRSRQQIQELASVDVGKGFGNRFADRLKTGSFASAKDQRFDRFQGFSERLKPFRTRARVPTLWMLPSSTAASICR